MSGGYPSMLDKWYTATQVRSANLALRTGMPIWGRDEVVDIPLHQVATKLATEVVVHSRYAADRVVNDFPWLPITVLPQLYPLVASHRNRSQLRTIALMGGGQINRRFDWTVQALAQIDSDLDCEIVLEIAGELEAAVLSQLHVLTTLRNVKLVNHGHVDDEQFKAVFERADLMIALRQPTMGEASAVVCKALQAGLPIIVSDQGWYAELPGCVKKIAPDGACPDELARVLKQLILDPSAYARWADECVDEAGRPVLDPFVAAETYARVIRSHAVFSEFRDRVAVAVAGLKIDIDSPLSSELQRIDVRASLRGDQWVDSALAALHGQELDSRATIVGATVGPYPYDAPLPESAYQGQVRLLSDDAPVASPSSTISFLVELSNNGDCRWFSPMDHSIRPFGIYLGHFWHFVDSTQPPAEQPRQPLEAVIEPLSSVTHEVTVRVPDVPGDYHLEIDLVQESVCWFRHRGFIPARLQVSVAAAQL